MKVGDKHILTVSGLKMRAHSRKPGYVEAALAVGIVNGDILELTDLQFQRLREKYAIPSTGAPLPPLRTMAGNLAAATGRTIISTITPGRKTFRTESEQSAILKICNTSGPAGAPCPYLRQADQRCLKCGCYTQWKSKLATEHCPDRPPKW
jgi:hypothetical protein